MSCNAFSFYSNVFGIITGSISLITLALGFQSYLPSKRIKTLEHLLEDTDQILSSAVEDGLLTEPKFRTRAYDGLAVLQKDASTLRSRAYRATTWTQDYKGLFTGLSFRIGKTCYRLKELRAEIVTSSEAERLNISTVRHATAPASSTDHAISPMDCNDRTDSDVTSIIISECNEADTAEYDKHEGELDAFREAPTKCQSDDTPCYPRLRLHWNDADECRNTPADAVEAVPYDQVGEVDDTVPYRERSDTCSALPQAISPGAHDLGGHRQPHGCSAGQIRS